MILSLIHGPRVLSRAGGHNPARESVSGEWNRSILCDALGHYGVGKGC